MSDWPPPLANRATRRACRHRSKSGICAYCGQITDSKVAAEHAAPVARPIPSTESENQA